MSACSCGREIVPPSPENTITASGGWCVPSDLLADLHDHLPEQCADCKARFLFALELGFDPGRDGEHLKVDRGGIRYA